MTYPKLEVVPINPEAEKNYTPMELELTAIAMLGFFALCMIKILFY